MQQRYSTAAAVGGGRNPAHPYRGRHQPVMPKANADAFTAHGNHHGQSAGVKVALAFELLSGNIGFHSLQAATEPDKSIAREVVAGVRRGDLVLRDMASPASASSPRSSGGRPGG